MIVRMARFLAVFEFDLGRETTSRLGKDLAQARIAISPKAYAGFAITASSLAFLSGLAVFLVFMPPPSALAGSFFAFACILAGLLNYPRFAKKRRAQLIERDLPLALRSAAVDLQFNTPFETVLRSLSSGYGEASVEFKRVSSDIERGRSVADALRAFAERVDGIPAKRVAMQLVFCYEHGFNAEGLRKLADELIERQKLASKEFAAKQSFFGLLFVSASTIVPALFSSFVIVGSSFLSLTFTEADLFAAFVIAFPLVDFALLYYLSLVKPKVLQ